MDRTAVKRWCFTINNPTDSDKFWEPAAGEDQFEYLILQEERGEQGTLHWQGFIIMKKPQRLSWMKNNINNRAHWERARGTNEQAREYCRKEETYTGGLRVEIGQLPQRAPVKKRDERLQEAAEELDLIKQGYKRPEEIPSMTLLQCGFIPAMKELQADVLGPYRPNIKILTMVGPPGTGKSYAIQKWFPEHGRCIYGNNGVWFQNATKPVMVFEEFCGQIRLQQMLQLLDPYPLALEVKGGMRPAMFETVIITSNTPPNGWYTAESEKKMDSVRALYDRLGYNDGNYVPIRKCGTYIQAPVFIPQMYESLKSYILACRETFERAMANISAEPVTDTDSE